MRPSDLNPEKDLPKGFIDFLCRFTNNSLPGSRNWSRSAQESYRLRIGATARLPPAFRSYHHGWRIEVPDWCADQRNQMTGPADDAELTVKLLNSGSPAVMLDVEDSTANTWEHVMLAINNTIAAYKYELSY